MQQKIFTSLVIMSIAFLTGLDPASAAESPELSGWIPYWRVSEGISSVRPHLAKFTEINPFVYTVRTDGSIEAQSSLASPEWSTFHFEAKQAGVRFIPTVMWSDADAMEDVLKDPAKRTAHIQSITREIYVYGLDGIDIDYEGKYAHTRTHFSAFLKELYEAIGYDKWVMCTIEARTPLTARYSSPESIPTDIEYSNDFKEINRYCDRVRIMAYDQGRVDLQLNSANNDPYIPIADRTWVEKVMRLAAEEISKDKLVIGAPTYGYEYDMFVRTDGGTGMGYSKLWAFNPAYALGLASTLNVTPTRTSGGEMSLVFPAARSPEAIKPLSDATRVLVWSDAEAIKQKINLASTLGVRGVALFKIDGGQDTQLWDVLPSRGTGTAVKSPNLSLTQEERSGGGSSPTAGAESSSTSLTVPTQNLSPGLTNENVRALQKLLNKHGFTITASGPGSVGNETTFFGNATYQALIRFQKAHKISPPIGHYGPLTRATMQKL